MGPVAVIVLSHRGPEQVSRLVDRLTRGTDTVAVVHHDPAGEPLALKPSSQVALVPDPVSPKWGRLSLVEAQWRSLRWVKDNVPDFSWVLLVSGQDYPIRSMGAIERELAASPHDAYLRHFKIGDPAEDVIPWQALTRHRYLYKRRLPFTHRSVGLPVQRRHPYRKGVDLYVGDMWFNLSATAVHAMFDAAPLSRALLRYLRFAPIPDETFIASMALNARPALDVAADSKRFITWGVRQAHPELITAAHLDDLRASSAFFARKIDPVAHPDVPDLLDGLAAARV
ncbi:beta-1,6-N-acetylglucosaminyltransferase [Spirillospora sp. CA-253888]